MTKISKNIKQFRKQEGLTQEALAKKMNVTRQAISNWENNKTQPDIDSLERLSEIFKIRIEELIYGKNKFIESENDKTRQKNVMKIFLSVFGSLFIGIGLVLLLFFFWVDFSLSIKTALSIVPLILGQGFTLFVYLKKKELRSWCESASILWCVGIISTIALINEIYNIHYGYENYLIIDALLCLPAVYVFNAVAPLAPYFYMILHWSIYSGKIIIGLILLTLGGLFILYNKNNINEGKIKFSIWLTVISSILFLTLNMPNFILSSPFLILFALVIVMFALSKRKPDFTLPFYTLGILGTFIMSILSSNAKTVYELFYYYGETFISKIYLFAFCLVLTAAGIFIGRESYKENFPKILITSFSVLQLLSVFIFTCNILSSKNSPYNFSGEFNFFKYILLIPSFLIGVSFILSGVKGIRIFEVNLGIITLFAELIQTTIIFIDIDVLALSVLFILFGGILIAANTALSKKKKENAVLFTDNKEEQENE